MFGVIHKTNFDCLFCENNLNKIQQINDRDKSQSADGYGIQPCSVTDDGKLDYQRRRHTAAGDNQPIVFGIDEQKGADGSRNQNVWALQHAVKIVKKMFERRNVEYKGSQQQADDGGQNIKCGIFLHAFSPKISFFGDSRKDRRRQCLFAICTRK